jgi:hypothetical protein
MPRKYKLKFGGSEGVSQPMNTTPLIIGVILLVIILPMFGLIGYYGFYLDKCKAKDDDDEYKYTSLCSAGKQLKGGTCEGECDADDEDTCCEEYNCYPPSTLQRGYKVDGGGIELLALKTFKSLSGFPGTGSSRELENVTCDTPNYEGVAKAVSCAGRSDKKWTFTGCDVAASTTGGGLPACVDGVNPGDGGVSGVTPRTPTGDCGDAETSVSATHHGETVNRRICDSLYHTSGRFCILNTNEDPDECVRYEQAPGSCSLPAT